MLIPKEVCAISAVAAREESRYAIHGVKLERNGKGSRAIATDGKRAIVVSWREGQGHEKFDANVDRQSLEAAGKAIRYRKADPEEHRFLCVHESEAPDWKDSATYGSGQAGKLNYSGWNRGVPVNGELELVDGVFPDCDQIIPPNHDDGAGVVFAINAQLLMELLQAMIKSTGETTVKIRVKDAKSVIRLDSVYFEEPCKANNYQGSYKDEGPVSATGVLMPMWLGWDD